MKGIILYKSKYGATKKYADWLSEKTAFTCMEIREANIESVKEYDVIILGGGIYASGIAGLSFLKKNIDVLKTKKIIVFCIGASPYDEKAFQEIKNHNMTGILSDIPLYYCRGAWNVSAMNIIDKGLCKMLQKAIAKKEPSKYEIWEKALAEAGNENHDWTDEKYIEPILNELKQYISE